MNKRNRQGGFTLIELIVSIVIFGIVLAAICGFMIAGAKSYTRINDRISAQMKLQLAADQISESLMDCNTGVVFRSSASGENISSALYVLNQNSTGDGYSVELFSLGQNSGASGVGHSLYYKSVSGVTYDAEEKNLSGVARDESFNDILLDKVNGFMVELYDVQGQKFKIPTAQTSPDKGKEVYTAKLTLSLNYGQNGEVLTVSKTLSLRNRPALIYIKT